MSDGPSESWRIKGRGILVTPTCPFCGEPLILCDQMEDHCSKCGKYGLIAEGVRIVSEKIGRHWKRFWAERERKVIERILGTSNDR